MVWRNSSCVVLGRHQNPWTECNLVRMAEDRIPLVRRISGGGAVYHDPGNVNFCFMGTETHYDLDRQFGVIVTALGSLGITARRNERNDLLIGDRKISGNAFRHRRHASLHHGTLLVKTDLTLLSTYLSASDTRPEISESKGIPSVRSGVTNLTETRPDLSYTDLLDAIHRAYENEFGPAAPPTEVAAGRIAAAERELKSWEWRYGKSPTFVGTVSATIVVPDRPDAILQLSVQVRRGRRCGRHQRCGRGQIGGGGTSRGPIREGRPGRPSSR